MSLAGIKLAHTVVWAFFAGCIVAIPFVDFRLALILSGLVWVECAVLLANQLRCPLTDVAARYTNDRADNFDIYLPVWLARYNKVVFGTWFFGAELFVLWRWLR